MKARTAIRVPDTANPASPSPPQQRQLQAYSSSRACNPCAPPLPLPPPCPSGGRAPATGCPVKSCTTVAHKHHLQSQVVKICLPATGTSQPSATLQHPTPACCDVCARLASSPVFGCVSAAACTLIRQLLRRAHVTPSPLLPLLLLLLPLPPSCAPHGCWGVRTCSTHGNNQLFLPQNFNPAALPLGLCQPLP